MNKNDFLARFLLSSYSKNPAIKVRNEDKKIQSIPSAVLIPLIEENNEVFIVFTKRASHLRKHAGQICFPGGKVENNDKHIIDTALRESQEEIGLSPIETQIVGQLKDYETLTGYRISPIVGFIPENTRFTIDTNEVAEIFKIPLKYFYQAHRYVEVPILRKQRTYNVNFITYEKYTIWGATAAILKDLAKL